MRAVVAVARAQALIQLGGEDADALFVQGACELDDEQVTTRFFGPARVLRARGKPLQFAVAVPRSRFRSESHVSQLTSAETSRASVRRSESDQGKAEHGESPGQFGGMIDVEVDARKEALKPPDRFIGQLGLDAWMKGRGQLGGQHKAPRVINDPAVLSSLENFMRDRSLGSGGTARHQATNLT
jgi:hypothetical protein